MFYVHNLQRRVLIEPRFLGPGLAETIHRRLFSTVEGTCSGEHGYVVSILAVDSTSSLCIDPVDGSVGFMVEFQALTLLPVKGEVVDAYVHEINKMGAFAQVGPMMVFISNYHIPGRMSAAGGEAVIVLNDSNVPVAKGTVLRLRIIGIKVEPTKVFAIGTINEDYLGPLQ